MDNNSTAPRLRVMSEFEMRDLHLFEGYFWIVTLSSPCLFSFSYRMASSSTFGYNDGLEDNPFGDLLSHTTGHSTASLSSIPDLPSQPTTTIDEQKMMDGQATTITTISSAEVGMTTTCDDRCSQDAERTIPSPSIPPPLIEQASQSPHLAEFPSLTITTQPLTLNEEGTPGTLHHTHSPDSLAHDGSDQQVTG